jgi:hypothetical protein
MYSSATRFLRHALGIVGDGSSNNSVDTPKGSHVNTRGPDRGVGLV